MNQDKKIVTEPIMNAVLELWGQSGQNLRMKMVSGSMRPLIREGNELLVELNPKIIRLGDVLVYYRDNLFIAHRLIKSYNAEGKRFLVLKGDKICNSDLPLPREKIVGRVIHVKYFLGQANYNSVKWRMINILISMLSRLINKNSNFLRRLKYGKNYQCNNG